MPTTQDSKRPLWVTFHWGFAHMMCPAQVNKLFLLLICLFDQELSWKPKMGGGEVFPPLLRTKAGLGDRRSICRMGWDTHSGGEGEAPTEGLCSWGNGHLGLLPAGNPPGNWAAPEVACKVAGSHCSLGDPTGWEKQFSPRAVRETHPADTCILDFQLPELSDDKFLLF